MRRCVQTSFFFLPFAFESQGFSKRLIRAHSAGIQAGQKVDIEKQHVYEEKIRQRPEWSCQTVL